ncbi:cysteine-rich receptor-like protein kinase 29 isoform X2 [Alnus glutinosa]|uniref:cysteine-rich receptor-like protein kinase 29 isoform X2 n=1 Tax=Alnus glutinosa TaxID=3517 RepID=UPI002D7796B1|nr:cysteine-rich receptor-like protein kinase 29 isoform X2 [Alnus glutinosa]
MAVVSSRLVFLSAICILIAPAIVRAQVDYNYDCSVNQGNYSSGSTDEKNRNLVLSPLSSNSIDIDYGFYNSSYGESPDHKVYAIGLCRGDLKPDECRNCLNIAKDNLTLQCPVQKEAIVFYEKCMLRYSTRNIFSTMDDTPEYTWMNKRDNISDYSADEKLQFRKDLPNLLQNLSGRAAAGGSHRKFAVGNVAAPRSQTIYGMVQCTPDLSEQDCNRCLSGAIDNFLKSYADSLGGRILRPSCNFRYENYANFLDHTAYAPPPPPPPPPPRNKSRTVIIVVVVSVVALVVLAISIYIVWKRRWKKPGNQSNSTRSTRTSSPMAPTATTPSSSKFRWDVFLSFRGVDTRNNFIDHLYTSLVQEGIRAFQDEEKLPRGETISAGLLNAIKESRIFIVVFSKNFASSCWCLDELVEIMSHRETTGRTLLPIFYHIKPSDVRSLNGTFAEAFAMHEEQFHNNIDKVDKWKKAFTKAADYPGLDLESIANGREAKFIKKIVDEVLQILKGSETSA